MTRYYSRPLMLGAALIAVLGLPFSAGAADSYYLSLGDSLAAGYQPIPPPWNHGYADQLQAKIPSLQLKKLGCYKHETTSTMINGGACFYPHQTQLAEAIEFLQDPNNSVALITIDIGANDVLKCVSGVTLDQTCISGALTGIRHNLPIILTALHTAAPGVPIVGMNYYDPLLASYINGNSAFEDSLPVFEQFNNTLERIYKAAGSRVANVEGAFSTFDFTTQVVSPQFGTIPLDVARICQWTWACTPSSDIHPNNKGYGVITRAFWKVLP